MKGVEDLAGDVALDAAHDLVFGFAFGQAAGEVVAGGLMAAHAHHQDDVQSPVCVAVAVTVAGEPKVKVGEPIAVDGLVAILWSQGDRSGVAFRAASIRSAGAESGVLGPRPTTAGGSSQSTPGAK